MLKLQKPVLSTGFVISIALQLVGCSPDLSSQTSFVRNGVDSSRDSLIAKAVLRMTMESASGDLYVCTGTLIAPDVILTAAHCIIDDDSPTPVPYESISVYQTRHEPMAEVKAARTIVHPLYLEDEKSKRLDNPEGAYFGHYDIGLILLKSPFPSEYIPARLIQDINQAFDQNVSISGYGNTSHDLIATWELTQPPKTGAFTLVQKFQQVYPSSQYVANRPYSTELIYQSTAQSPAICHGDSGGPLYFEKEGAVTLIAVNARTWSQDNKASCEPDEQFQFATALTGEIREFVRNSYSELTGRNADEILPEIKNDPNVPENHFGDETLPQKNVWLNLTQFPLAISTSDSKFTTLTLVESKRPKEDLCTTADIKGRKALVIHIFPHDQTPRGNSHVYTFSMLIEDGSFKPVQRNETYARLEKNTVELIAMTPDGMLRTKIPVTDCVSNPSHPHSN